jgi:hypothetical protein
MAIVSSAESRSAAMCNALRPCQGMGVGCRVAMHRRVAPGCAVGAAIGGFFLGLQMSRRPQIMSGACRAQDDTGKPNARALLPSRGGISRVLANDRPDATSDLTDVRIATTSSFGDVISVTAVNATGRSYVERPAISVFSSGRTHVGGTIATDTLDRGNVRGRDPAASSCPRASCGERRGAPRPP